MENPECKVVLISDMTFNLFEFVKRWLYTGIPLLSIALRLSYEASFPLCTFTNTYTMPHLQGATLNLRSLRCSVTSSFGLYTELHVQRNDLRIFFRGRLDDVAVAVQNWEDPKLENKLIWRNFRLEVFETILGKTSSSGGPIPYR